MCNLLRGTLNTFKNRDRLRDAVPVIGSLSASDKPKKQFSWDHSVGQGP